MIAEGYDDYTVMEINGRSFTRMLARYTRPTADRKVMALGYRPASFRIMWRPQHSKLEPVC